MKGYQKRKTDLGKRKSTEEANDHLLLDEKELEELHAMLLRDVKKEKVREMQGKTFPKGIKVIQQLPPEKKNSVDDVLSLYPFFQGKRLHSEFVVYYMYL